MSNKHETLVPFGLLNIAGLMETKPVKDSDGKVIGAEVTVPLYCTQSYKVKTTFNRTLDDDSFALMPDGFYYQKKFRRMVLWDFGDGFTSEEYSVEHSYEKPGRYEISCTFYDINRVAWKNTYKIIVVVKELLPTQLQFDKEITKRQVLCSKIEKIARLQATLSCNCKEDLQIVAKRIFTEEEEDSGYEEIGKNFQEIPEELYKFAKKYWTFLENEQVLCYQSDKVLRDKLHPTTIYTPNYTSLYGKFYYDADDKEEPLKVAIYQVIPYKNIDDNLKTVRILNPNCKIDDLLAHDGGYNDYLERFTKVVDITQVYLDEQLPEYASFIGKRAWVDIFYKNDFISNSNLFSFHYNIEDKNITKELLSSDNYLNINPLGMELSVVQNDKNKVKVGVSLDGFLRSLDKEKNYTIDEYLLNSLVDGIDLEFYFFPYIEYGDDVAAIDELGLELYEDETTDYITNSTNEYYIPKDIVFDKRIDCGKGDCSSEYIGYIEMLPWVHKMNFRIIKDFIFDLTCNIGGKSIKVIFDENTKVIDADNIITPAQLLRWVDVDELIDTYMAHPMFDEADNTKDFFKIVLKGNDMLKYTITRSHHFLNDTANVRTCYLKNLIETLKMMGEDVLEFEKGGFEGVNELRDFVRVLSMNHSDLVGHVIKKDYDITIQRDNKGVNVGDEIEVNDVLTVSDGKIKKLTRNGQTYDYTEWDKNGVLLIVQDKYTFKTKIVNLGLCGKTQVSIGEYLPSWGWNLLLPTKFDDCLADLEANEKYKTEHNGRELLSTKDKQRIQESMKQLIRGYYAFYVLNPEVETERVGNFISNYSITERVEDPEKWDEEWGIKHEVLMKIFRDIGNYKHGYTEVTDSGQTYSRRRIANVENMMVVDKKLDVFGSVYVDGILDKDKVYSTQLQVVGCLFGEGENILEMQLLEGDVDGSPIRTEDDYLAFRVVLDKDNEISPTKQVFNLVGEHYSGTLSVKLCGKVRISNGIIGGMLWDVTADLFSK